MNMGQSITIKGELSGAEDLTVEGQVEGKINLARQRAHRRQGRPYHGGSHRQGRHRAWSADGNVTVKEKFELSAGGAMQGNVKAPRIAMADGAVFNGKVEMPGAKAIPAPAAAQKLEPVGV